jgi:hypothetical protein
MTNKFWGTVLECRTIKQKRAAMLENKIFSRAHDLSDFEVSAEFSKKI